MRAFPLGRHLASCFLGAILVSSGGVGMGDPALRPIPGKGPGANTLILHSGVRVAYGLGDELEFLKLLLRTVATTVEALPAAQASAARLARADYLIFFAPEPEPSFPSAALEAVAATNKPVLWVGHGAEQLAELPPFRGAFGPQPDASGKVARVKYRAREWDIENAYWIPMGLLSNRTVQAEVLLGTSGASGRESLPICWRMNETTVFSAVPVPGRLGFLLTDLLLDFYGARNIPAGRVVVRIDDYQPASDHRQFKKAVDFLASRGHSFAVSVTPAWRDPITGSSGDLTMAPDYVKGLRYAQQRGGRIILRGLGGVAAQWEFWDMTLDRPPAPNPPLGLRGDLERAAGMLLQQGLLPVAWQTPQDSASRAVYAEIAQVFSTGMERPQLGDLTQREKGLIPTLTLDAFGRQLLPENLGYVSGGTNGFQAVRMRAQFLGQLRGTIGGCFIHAYQPLEQLTGLVDGLEDLRLPFLDLAELDNWVHTRGRLLLTGAAQKQVTLATAAVKWRAFDRSGRMIATEEETGIKAGEHTFQRKGKGHYELFEFTETAP